jgi:hypothetical protein
VQEAKEIPTVKVLDPPVVPEKKVFPPRTIIIFLGTSLSCIGGVILVFGQKTWIAMSADDPRRLLMRDAFASIDLRAADSIATESGVRGWAQRLFRRFERRRDHQDKPAGQ